MVAASQIAIIMPLFNCDRYVGEAIESILGQTFQGWQLTIVDDCSTDNSVDVVQKYLGDRRITLMQHDKNRGAAETRNTAILNSVTNRYLAYMDSDDLWLPEKLEKQLNFMKATGSAMCFTSYETIEADGTHRNYVHVPAEICYKGFLKNTITCSHTIMFDLAEIDFNWLLVDKATRDFDFPEDMAAWCTVLKHGVDAHGLDMVLAKNRKHNVSRSSNKLHAVKRTWNQYRRIEGLSVPYAAYCHAWQLFHAIKKRI